MKAFVELITTLDQNTKVNARLHALLDYFEKANHEDKLWAIALFTGRRPKRPMTSTKLREWAANTSQTPFWLFEETYHIVGDLAETIALLLPPPEKQANLSLGEWIKQIQSLQGETDEKQQAAVLDAWSSLDYTSRFVFNKLLTGGFRIGVSQKMITKALAMHLNKEEANIAHRLMGNWTPDNTSFHELMHSADQRDDLSKPYPFYLAYPIDFEINDLGATSMWQAEWKWDGIRGQLIKRGNQSYLWSRGEELVTDKYPEIAQMAEQLPNGTVLDGEILAFKNQPLPFQMLQTRIGRKRLSKKQMEEVPVVFMAYDILELNGIDLRFQTLKKRREKLEGLFHKQYSTDALKLSPQLNFETWDELITLRAESRAHFSEGLMLKRLDSAYQTGRKRGDWWKWKVDALVIDAVLVYAMRGHGRRANLYTDYTFAVWDEGKLVPFTKAYSGLTDEEFKQVDAFVKQNTLDRFGPVRSVDPVLVFEIAFEGIAASTRHKSGLALRFPRMKRWRQDKPASEANTLEDLKTLLRHLNA